MRSIALFLAAALALGGCATSTAPRGYRGTGTLADVPVPPDAPEAVAALLEADRAARGLGADGIVEIHRELVRMPDRLRRQPLAWITTHSTTALRIESGGAERIEVPLGDDWRAARRDGRPPWPARWVALRAAPPQAEVLVSGAVPRASILGADMALAQDTDMRERATAGMANTGLLRLCREWRVLAEEPGRVVAFGWCHEPWHPGHLPRGYSVALSPGPPDPNVAYALWLDLRARGETWVPVEERSLEVTPLSPTASVVRRTFAGHERGPDGAFRATQMASTRWDTRIAASEAAERFAHSGGAAALEALLAQLDAGDTIPFETSTTLTLRGGRDTSLPPIGFLRN